MRLHEDCGSKERIRCGLPCYKRKNSDGEGLFKDEETHEEGMFFVMELEVSEFRKGEDALICLSIVW